LKQSVRVGFGDLEGLHSPIGRRACLPGADLGLGNVSYQIGGDAPRVCSS
jgi:hypothetical protein